MICAQRGSGNNKNIPPSAHATTAVAEAGNVYIPAASACPWVMDFVEEMAAFPSGAHDDQVDCYSQANAYYNDNTFDIRSLIT